ncbi:MAG: hypothetical protein EHM21_03105 [Chloroflexi bacterium]|nr:MAG: hypothetical protein EHM21_03105 [Chloroflexota bacterium]
MHTIDESDPVKIHNYRTIAGILLLVTGGILFLDRFLKTGWLSLLVLPVIGFSLYFWGIRRRLVGLILAGGLVSAVGLGSMAAWGPAVRLDLTGRIGLTIPPHSPLDQIGYLALYTGIGRGLILLTPVALGLKPIWWALLPAGISGALGFCLLFSPLRWVDFVFYLALGVGLPLLLWGIIRRRVGLMIPGCLLLGAGIGVYLAWRGQTIGNGLAQTGVMLVGFAFGWLAISVIARQVVQKNIWWPLIPGGILAVVGMGLYIGGDPTHALGFIGNTGSIALMIFGLYLLLMRKGIHH